MSIKFQFLAAGKGDAILISTQNRNILIDGGEKYRFIDKHISKLELLDLVILTHIDDDHIKGLIELLGKEIRKKINSIWFNPFDKATKFSRINRTNETSFTQGITFYQLVEEMKKINTLFSYDDKIYIEEKPIKINLFETVDIELLSPTREKLQILNEKYENYCAKHKPDFTTSGKKANNQETCEKLADNPFQKDTSPTNGASIAFILTYQENDRFLLLADAHIDVIVTSLKEKGFSENHKLKVNFVKLSHHGSKHNINQDFLNLIETDTFIISTNGSGHEHPDKETLCKIVKNLPRIQNKFLTFYFNDDDNCKRCKKYFNYQDFEKYNFSLKLLEKNGLTFGE